MSEKQPLIQGNTPGYPQGAPTSYPGTSGYPGGAQQGGYGGTQQAPGPYGAAQGGYPGGAPPQQGGYPPPQQGGYQGGQPPQQGGYPGGPPPQQGGYPGGPPPQQGGYPGGPPPQQGGYPGGPPPQQGGYPGGPVGTQGGAPQSGAPQYKGDMPADDVEDNPNAVAPTPSAPSIDKMDEISGYSNVGFSGAALPPPSYDEAMKGPPPERQHISNVPTITEQEAREALLAFVAENCCYGKGAAEDLKFNDLQSSSAFHYTLETFGEGRQTSWAYEPFTGQPIDSPMNGPAPGPWDIQANPPTLFKNFKSEIEVPHTASVKPCHNCFASGYVRCHRCHGRGRVRCGSCGGSGHTTVFRDGEHQRERCVFCHGNGRRRCDTCRGCGMVECSVCKSYRQLKCYIKLTILWTNHVADHIVERTPLPDHLIRGVTGQLAFDETQPRVWPLQHFHEAEINSASSRLIREQQFPNERILQQRHQVRIVPVTQCMFRWKDNDSDFFVYGFEHKVHAPNYPQQCCCGCSIL